MKTLTLSAIALTLLTSVAYARDNDARDTYHWLNSVSQSDTRATQADTNPAYHSDVAVPQKNSRPDEGPRH